MSGNGIFPTLFWMFYRLLRFNIAIQILIVVLFYIYKNVENFGERKVLLNSNDKISEKI